MEYQKEIDKKEKFISELLTENKKMKEKIINLKNFYKDINNPIQNNDENNNYIYPRFRNSTNIDKKKLNETKLYKDELYLDLDLDKITNKNIKILFQILLIYKEIDINNDKKLLIESKIKLFLEIIGNNNYNQSFIQIFNLLLQSIYNNVKNENYHTIISNLESLNVKNSCIIKNLKFKINEFENKIIKLEGDVISISNSNKKLINDINNLEEENEGLKFFSKKSNITINGLQVEVKKIKESNLNESNQFVYEKLRIKELTIVKLLSENKELKENFKGYVNENTYLLSTINNLKKINREFFEKLNNKEHYITKINSEYYESLNNLEEIYKNKFLELQNTKEKKQLYYSNSKDNYSLSVSFDKSNENFENNFDIEHKITKSIIQNQKFDDNINTTTSNFEEKCIKLIEDNLNLNKYNEDLKIKIIELEDSNEHLVNKVMELNSKVINLKNYVVKKTRKIK